MKHIEYFNKYKKTYSPVQPRDWILVKDYGSLSFAKNIDKHLRKLVSKYLGGKYSQKRLDQVKQSATDAVKTASKKPIQ